VSCFKWPPLKRKKKIVTLIPSSVLSVDSSLLEKTYKAGYLSRTLALYRIDEVIIYSDANSTNFDAKFLELILKYQVTPPHIKKKLFKKSRLLRYAGLLPPVRLPNHDPPKEARVGYVLDGIIENCREGICHVFLGKLSEGILRIDGNISEGKIVTVKIHKIAGDKIYLKKSDWKDIYTGYKVRRSKRVEEITLRLSRDGYLVIGTSRLGSCITKDLINEIESKLTKKKGIALVIGGPYKGIDINKGTYDYVLNTVINQGTITVRSEEALISTLSILNLFTN